MSRERPTINSAAGDELWLLKSCQSRVGHDEDSRAVSAASRTQQRPFPAELMRLVPKRDAHHTPAGRLCEIILWPEYPTL